MNDSVNQGLSIGRQQAYIQVRNKIQARREETFRLMTKSKPVTSEEIAVFEAFGKLEEEINDLIREL